MDLVGDQQGQSVGRVNEGIPVDDVKVVVIKDCTRDRGIDSAGDRRLTDVAPSEGTDGDEHNARRRRHHRNQSDETALPVGMYLRLQHVVRPQVDDDRVRMMTKLPRQRGKHLIDPLPELRLNVGVIAGVQILGDVPAGKDGDRIPHDGNAWRGRPATGQGRNEEYTSHHTFAHTGWFPNWS